MRIAVNRGIKDPKSGEWKEEVFFIDVVAWRELADRSKDKAKKGVPVVVEGRLTSREYEDKRAARSAPPSRSWPAASSFLASSRTLRRRARRFQVRVRSSRF